ncbi:MAG: hypothetical protein GY814_04125 [Gammaproteobacteria bacterium]|nr:hypothetical protein [Gammaproteobacteria bacterium]
MEDDVKSIAAEIMKYLHQRPMASDSLDGITHWWLVQQEITKNMDLVEQALTQLAQEGKVSKKMSANREAIYSLDPAYKPTKG